MALNRPRQLNTLNLKMQRAILQAIEEANESASVYILKSTSPGRVFCAGGDVIEASTQFAKHFEDGILRYYKMFLSMAKAKPITVAFWDGIVMGGGAGLSSNCNIRIATENTQYAMPEAKLGYLTDVGSTYFLSRLRKNIGLFLAFSAYSLKGKEAYQVGIADYYVQSKNLPALEAEIERVSQFPAVNEAMIREVCEKFAENIFKSYDGEDVIDELFQGKDVEEIINKLKEESQENERVGRWYQDIMKNSPMSFYYSFELLKRGKSLNLQEALSLEAYLTERVNFAEFQEGIRAVLKEKGSKPNWSLKVEELKNLNIDDYFPRELKVLDFLAFKEKETA